jgi:hypothetical protein
MRSVFLSLLSILVATVAYGQSPVRKTPWGDPDLQGTWPGGQVFAVPFERDPKLGTRATLTPVEAAKRNADLDADLADSSANFFPEIDHTPPQASLIVEPENGQLPVMTEGGAQRAYRWRMVANPEYPALGPEELRPYDRCITRGVLGSAFPNSYSSGMQIHQAPGFVVIRYEMIHEARIIPLDGRPVVRQIAIRVSRRVIAGNFTDV